MKLKRERDDLVLLCWFYNECVLWSEARKRRFFLFIIFLFMCFFYRSVLRSIAVSNAFAWLGFDGLWKCFLLYKGPYYGVSMWLYKCMFCWMHCGYRFRFILIISLLYYFCSICSRTDLSYVLHFLFCLPPLFIPEGWRKIAFPVCFVISSPSIMFPLSSSVKMLVCYLLSYLVCLLVSKIIYKNKK